MKNMPGRLQNGKYWTYVSKKLSIAIGLLLSVLGLWYAFHDLDIQEIWISLKSVNLPLLASATILMLYSVWVRAQRWRLIVMPFKEVKTSVLFGSAMIGYFGNAILPLRMGEILRGYSLGQMENMSSSAVFGTIILERILDIVGLVVIIIIFMFVYPTTELMGLVLYGIIFITIGVILLIIWLSQTKLPWESWGSRFAILQSPMGAKVWKMIENVVSGIISIRKTHHALEISLYTIALWALYYVYIYILVLSMNLPLNWVAVGVILITTTLSISVPSAPGYIGTYHAVAVAVLTELFSIGLHDSQAFAVILHAVGYIPFIIVGSYYFVHNSIHLADIKKK